MSEAESVESAALDTETERVRGIMEKLAPSYDRTIGFAEKLLFGDGRAWVCSRARGDVLEVAIGSGRRPG